MRAIVAMVGKDLRVLFRDRMGFFFTFFFPLTIAIFFGTVFSGGSNSRAIPIAVVDEDRTAESRAFAGLLSHAPEFEVDPMGRADAAEAVRLGKRTAFVLLPPGFGAARSRMFYGHGPEVELGLDPSRRAEAGMIQGVLTKYLSEKTQEMFAHPDNLRGQVKESMASLDSARDLPAPRRASIRRFLGELDRYFASEATDTRAPRDTDTTAVSARDSIGWRPVNFKTTEIARVRRGPRNAYQISFPQGIIWAMLSTAFGFALSLVNERVRGTLVRLRMAPVPRRMILIGKAVGCLVAIVTVTSVLMGIGAAVFGVRPPSWPLLVMAIGSAAFGFVGVMLLISVMGRTQPAVSGLGWATMMAMSMTGGGMIPLFAMPPWMANVGVWSPVRWAILAFEGAIWRDFTFAQMALPCGVLLGIGALGCAIGFRVFRWTEA